MGRRVALRLTWSVAVLVMVLLVSNTVSGGKGDSEGEGCSRGLAGTDGDGLGVRNETGGDRIPVQTTATKGETRNRYGVRILTKAYLLTRFSCVYQTLRGTATRNRPRDTATATTHAAHTAACQTGHIRTEACAFRYE